MPLVNVIGKGLVKFPDGMKPQEIYQVMLDKFGPKGMTTEARMQRAKEQGFGEAVYRGKGKEDQKARSGITWVSTDPKLASEYAAMRGWGTGEHVEPLLSSAKKPVRFYHAEQRKKPSEMLSEVMEQMDSDNGRAFVDEDLARKQYQSIRERLGDQPQEINKIWQDPEVADFIRNAGFDSIRAPEGGASGVDTIGLLNKADRRSVNAAFDPDLKDSPNLLASAAPVAVGLGAMAQGDEAEAANIPPASTGTIEAAKAPIFLDAANLMRKLELPIVGHPLLGLADWAEGVAFQDDDRLKRAAIGALDIAP